MPLAPSQRMDFDPLLTGFDEKELAAVSSDYAVDAETEVVNFRRALAAAGF